MMNRLDQAPMELTLNERLALADMLLEEATAERERLSLAIKNTKDPDDLINLRQSHYAASQDEERADQMQREILWFIAELN